MSKRREKITVGVIFGGRSGEHEVSLVSARSVIKSLDKRKYTIVPIGITKEGKWLSSTDALPLLTTHAYDTDIRPELTLVPDPKIRTLVPTASGKKPSTRKLDVIFPVLHGPLGEDGTIQGLFELADIPYVGAGVLGSAVAMDKDIMKRLFLVAGLPIVQFISFTFWEWRHQKKYILREMKKIGYPLFVKPANMGSSVGISKVHTVKQINSAIKKAFAYDRKVVVEKSIENARDIECSVLGNNAPRSSVPGEIISSNEFYDYDAKYVDGKSQATIPAKLSRKQSKIVREMAIRAFKALDLCGMARVDFLVRGRRIWVNEANTIPGFTDISMYPKLWEATGVSYSDLLDELITHAIERHREKSKLTRQYRPSEEWHKR